MANEAATGDPPDDVFESCTENALAVRQEEMCHMRRGSTLALAAVLLLLMLSPLASAAGKTPRSTSPTLPPYVPPDSTSDPALAHATESTSNASVHPASDAASLISLGVGGVGLLMLSLLMARKARGPRAVRLPRRSFEMGRAMGRSTRVESEDQALARLRSAPDVGQVTALGATPGRVRVQVARRRGEPCELVSGYLTGLFEEAWASDVAIRHDACAGKKRATPCEYDIIRVGPPMGGASTRGSEAAKDRSLQAPAGPA